MFAQDEILLQSNVVIYHHVHGHVCPGKIVIYCTATNSQLPDVLPNPYTKTLLSTLETKLLMANNAPIHILVERECGNSRLF